MAWINLLLFILSIHAEELPRFLTKHSPETLRFISSDGRYAYVQKKPGVLGLVSSFRSVDFLSESNSNDFLVNASRTKKRLIIESIPNSHTEMSLLKNHKIFVIDYGNTNTRVVGIGRGAKLHLGDEWISFYNMITKVLHIENLITEKKYQINLSKKPNPFFMPDVEMISSGVFLYTEINEDGLAALISFDLQRQKGTIQFKSSQNGTQLELCQADGYLGIGEFPYEGVKRGSKIQVIKTSSPVNLSGMTTIYNSVEQDIGNMVCLPKFIYFVKTINHDEQLGLKVTEAAQIDLLTQNLNVKTDLKVVSQLLEMDDRVLIPLRGEFIVLQGRANLSEDILRPTPTKEELQIDI